MRGSVRPCWTGSRTAPTFWRRARNRIGSGGRRKSEIDQPRRRRAKATSCGNDGPWKEWKTKQQVSHSSHPLGNPQEQRIPTFTTATAAAIIRGAAVHTPPHSNNNNIPRWARINRRNGPKEVAKLSLVRQHEAYGLPFLQGM